MREYRRLTGGDVAIAVDHLTDMLTRSLSCQLIMGAGNYMSVRLDVLDDNDTCQQWDVIRA